MGVKESLEATNGRSELRHKCVYLAIPMRSMQPLRVPAAAVAAGAAAAAAAAAAKQNILWFFFTRSSSARTGSSSSVPCSSHSLIH